MSSDESDWEGKISIEPPSDPEQVGQLYDEFAATYNDTLEEWRYTAPRTAATKLRARLDADAAILDAGCGTGLTGAALRKQGFAAITGIDLSPTSVALARNSGHYCQVQVADLAAKLAFDTDSFDGILCVGVLSYLPDAQFVLLELLRVLRPGGVLVFTQREDLYVARDNERLFAELENRGHFLTLEATQPQPYLPGHPDFGEKIGARYFTWQAT